MRKGKTKDFLKLIKHAPDKVEPYQGEKILADRQQKTKSMSTSIQRNDVISLVHIVNQKIILLMVHLDIELYKKAWRKINLTKRVDYKHLWW